MPNAEREEAEEHGFWQHTDGYRVAVSMLAGVPLLFFLVVMIMPTFVFQTLEDIAWEMKTFAASYHLLVVLVGLVLFILSGWDLLRFIRGPRVLVNPWRHARRPAAPTARPVEGIAERGGDTASEKSEAETAEGVVGKTGERTGDKAAPGRADAMPPAEGAKESVAAW